MFVVDVIHLPPVFKYLRRQLAVNSHINSIRTGNEFRSKDGVDSVNELRELRMFMEEAIMRSEWSLLEPSHRAEGIWPWSMVEYGWHRVRFLLWQVENIGDLSDRHVHLFVLFLCSRIGHGPARNLAADPGIDFQAGIFIGIWIY